MVVQQAYIYGQFRNITQEYNVSKYYVIIYMWRFDNK